MNDPQATLQQISRDLAEHRSVTMAEALPIMRRAAEDYGRAAESLTRMMVNAGHAFQDLLDHRQRRWHGPVPVKAAHKRRYSR